MTPRRAYWLLPNIQSTLAVADREEKHAVGVRNWL